ncbi:hypothetical protein CAOG_008169 [Capsaspora owczarzaki ATCC 30864]|uniref:Uncharacterized protein n=1 Tax=Capsaspora owczarzaki (strain ATCC 30864) TaxID=595528 RepID=A0A0D2UT74_CAPO3|nr:hypothetical protein CAOG_008169 [Capsaspora owczarzaki ATCC 30864]
MYNATQARFIEPGSETPVPVGDMFDIPHWWGSKIENFYLHARHAADCVDLVDAYAQASNISYKFIVKSRFDLVWKCPFPDLNRLPDSHVYGPNYQMYGGQNDKMLIIPYRWRGLWRSFMLSMTDHSTRLDRDPVSAEQYLAAHIYRERIPRKPIELFVRIMLSSGNLGVY